MNKSALLPKMAINGVKKNGGMYIPYILTMTFAIAVFIIFSSIIQNKMLENVPYSVYVIMLLQIGRVLLSIIMIPFLFYTNSFLSKRRKKEFGLYNILGLAKREIGVVLFFETMIIYFISMIAGALTACVFGKLVFLLLLNISNLPVTTGFQMGISDFLSAMILFGVISFMNLFTNLWQIGKANPTDLLSGPKKGEKEPKHLVITTILGLLFLGAGYEIAFVAKVDSMVFLNFFLAVFLVIIGTYFVFTSGSIALLKVLKKNKKFYYKKENYVTISGMLYRMKKSAASLSNICIFSTMIIITLLCTVALSVGEEGAIRFNYPLDAVYVFSGSNATDVSEITKEREKIAECNDIKITDSIHFNYFSFDAIIEGMNIESVDPKQVKDRTSKVKIFSAKEYEEMTGKGVSLKENELLLFTTTLDYEYSEIALDGTTFTVKEQLSDLPFETKEPHSYGENVYFIVMNSWDQIVAFPEEMNEASIKIFYESYQFNVAGEEAQKSAFYDSFLSYCKEQKTFDSFKNSLIWKFETQSMNGGLLFIGIFFGMIFTICLILIMYYKQISEGIEDKSNFEIMQEVGMDDHDVKATIHRQIMLVFYMPLLLAIVHTFVGLNLTINLLYALNLYETNQIRLCAGIVIVVFAIFYSLSYSVTAKAYFKIVKRKE